MKKNFLFLFISALFLSLLSCKNNVKYLEDEKAGIEYYKKGVYEKALTSLEKANSLGSADAAYYLGEMFRQGRGVDKNYSVACRYYQKSAEADNKKAYLNAGMCHIPDKKDENGFKEVFKWFKRAAEEINETDLGGQKKRPHRATIRENLYLECSITTVFHLSKTYRKP